MSLINEALKRAKEADNKAQPKTVVATPSPSEPTMRPVEQPAKASNGSPAIYILSTALVFVVIGAFALLWMWSNSQKPSPVPVNTLPTVATTPAVPVTPPMSKVPEPQMAPAPEPVPTAVAVVTEKVEPVTAPAPVAEPVVAQTSPPAAELVAPPSPQFPTLKLQGIFFNSRKPSAVINGKAYFKGGTVSGASIVDIEVDKVTVEWNGEKRVLETVQ